MNIYINSFYCSWIILLIKLKNLNENWLIVYIYIYIYMHVCVCVCVCVLFGPVKPESGIIPSGQKTFNYEHLNFPGKELNVTDITEQ